MDIAWTAHIANKPEDKKSFEEVVVLSRATLDRLAQITKERRDSISKAEHSLSSYEDVNWSHKQAFLNGKRAVYDEYLQLLTL